MKDFVALTDYTADEVNGLIHLATTLKEGWRNGGNEPILQGKSLALIFQKPSLRTRISFEMAMVHLGGYAFYMSPQEANIGQRETVADAARVLSGYVDGVMGRFNSHADLVELAEYASIPVINGLTDFNHPAQALTDLFTIFEQRQRLEGLTLTYVGDGNNVARSLVIAAMMCGLNVRVATPLGYGLSEDDLSIAEANRISDKQSISIFTDPISAVTETDIVYTDVWISMGQEAESADRNQVFPPYQLNADLIRHAKPDHLVMHCLPAHRGQEITDEVADGPSSVFIQQAHNRLHAQKAILAHLME